ncbi:MAG: GTPase domain-containing protein [Phycisphaerae bacterium]|nr:GTPase domain-containing protein [Phycisphaerae bacterium]
MALTTSTYSADGAPGSVARLLTALRQALTDPAAPSHDGPIAAPGGGRERQRDLEFARDVVSDIAPPAETATDSLPHIVVFGPTQAGKSSVANAIVAANVAGVSPLAGYTVRPSACVHAAAAPQIEDCRWLAGLRPTAALSAQQADPQDTFVVSHTLPSAASSPLLACVVWDTPDFDSLAADRAQSGLLQALATADVFVLVVSKEKYADLSVWRMLRLLADLRRPLVVVLNKLTPEAEAVVPEAFRARLQALPGDFNSSPIVTLPQLDGDTHHRAAALIPAARTAREAIARAAEALPADTERIAQRRRNAARWLRRHWDEWLTPLRAEHSAIDAWRQSVDGALYEFVDTYRRDFLEDPRRYDCFRLATVELLRLLEVPGVSNALAQTRAVVTWPVRRLFQAGRDWLSSVRRPGDRDAGGAPRGAEELVLQSALDRMLTGLRHGCARHEEGGGRANPQRTDEVARSPQVWRAIAARLDAEDASLRAELAQHLALHAAAAQREIERTAEELYAILQKNPAALAGLRATRAVADAAGLALAFKTGGLHFHDLLLAPAMLAATSFLGEGVLSTYMSQSAASLKQRLLADVRERLVGERFRPTLVRLGQGLRGDGLIGITPDETDAADAAIRAWETAR